MSDTKRNRAFSALSAAMLVASPFAAGAVDRADVVSTYADIASAKYEDSLIAAKALSVRVDLPIGGPGILVHQSHFVGKTGGRIF